MQQLSSKTVPISVRRPIHAVLNLALESLTAETYKVPQTKYNKLIIARFRISDAKIGDNAKTWGQGSYIVEIPTHIDNSCDKIMQGPESPEEQAVTKNGSSVAQLLKFVRYSTGMNISAAEFVAVYRTFIKKKYAECKKKA